MSQWPVQWAYATATVVTLLVFVIGYVAGRRGGKKKQ